MPQKICQREILRAFTFNFNRLDYVKPKSIARILGIPLPKLRKQMLTYSNKGNRTNRDVIGWYAGFLTLVHKTAPIRIRLCFSAHREASALIHSSVDPSCIALLSRYVLTNKCAVHWFPTLQCRFACYSTCLGLQPNLCGTGVACPTQPRPCRAWVSRRD